MNALRAAGREAVLLKDADAIVEGIAPELRPGDVVAILSNGGFDGIYDKLPRRLRELTAAAQGLEPMLPALTLLLVYLILGIPAALVGIPWTLVSRQYPHRISMGDVDHARRAAFGRDSHRGCVARTARSGEALHLSFQSRLKSRSSSAVAAAARKNVCLR